MKNINLSPKTSLKNKTGVWRTHKPITDDNKCIGCHLCAKLCPEGCIDMIKIQKKDKPRTDLDYCKGCGLCADQCPVKAIKMEQEY